MRTRVIAAAASLGLAAALLPGLSTVARAGLALPCAGTDWPMFGHDTGRSFASPDTCISNATAATLAPKWFFNTSSPVTAQPVVVGDTVYVGAFNGTFYAIDSAHGTQRWSFDATAYDHEKNSYGVIPGSAAVTTLGGRNLVVFGGGDTLFVLDATPGIGDSQRLLSHTCLDRLDPTCQGRSGIVSEIETSPAIVPWTNGNQLVLVGQDANEANPSPVEGMIALVLAPDGSVTPLWQFDPETNTATVGLAPLESTPTGRGCGDVWSSPAVDLVARRVFFGVGNCNRPSPADNPNQVESTYAISLDTGALAWQAKPRGPKNGLDLDFGATPNLLGNGMVGEAGKDGVYYAYDIAGGPASPNNWKVTAATASSIGGMIATPAVGQITTLAGAVHQAIFADSAIPVSQASPQGSMQNNVMHPTQALGVHAIDAVTHQVVWDAPAGPSYGAAVYDNGVVFTPDTFTDSLLVLDANTGAILRTIPLNAPPSGPVAVAGDSIYGGSGTTESGPPLNTLAAFGGVWAFQTGA